MSPYNALYDKAYMYVLCTWTVSKTPHVHHSGNVFRCRKICTLIHVHERVTTHTSCRAWVPSLDTEASYMRFDSCVNVVIISSKCMITILLSHARECLNFEYTFSHHLLVFFFFFKRYITTFVTSYYLVYTVNMHTY